MTIIDDSVLSSNASAHEVYSHGLSGSPRSTARNVRSSGRGQHSIGSNAEHYGPHDFKRPSRRLHTRAAASTAHAGRHAKKGKGKGMTEEETLAILNFPGLSKKGLESGKYLRYRERVNQKVKDGSQQNVWPDHVEHAFQFGELGKGFYIQCATR
ncbi:MAG: hypothetical protein LQ346_003191 [Caloplaca aetnensis]|nr:MAG: hypothetical protein LQ346_003191 [Caloplaca aetnensis]